MATTQQYSLKWNNYISHLAYHFESLRSEDEFTDVTLCCEGKRLKAHKIILSACSTYFKDVFKDNPHPHPVIIFKNVKFTDLQSIIQFMYNGEVSVIQDLLPSFLQTAELLQVRGLTDTNLTESAKNLVAEEPRQTETLFFAVPQETNKILTALTTTPLKQATVQQGQEIHTIRLDASKLMDDRTPTLIKRKKLTVQQQQQQQATVVQPSVPTVQTVQTYETLGLDQEGELMEAEEGVEFLQTGMKMEMPDFIDVPTSDRTVKVTTATGEQASYIQQELTYHVIDGRVMSKNVTTSQATQQAQVEQEQEQMETAENESGDLTGIFTQSGTDDLKGQEHIESQSYKVIHFNDDNTDVKEEDVEEIVIAPRATRASKDSTTAFSGGQSASGATGASGGGGGGGSAPVTCETCRKTFTSASALRRHTMSKHSALSVKFQCSQCGMSYKTKWSLSTHISRYHRAQSEKMVRRKNVKPSQMESDTDPDVSEFVVVKSG